MLQQNWGSNQPQIHLDDDRDGGEEREGGKGGKGKEGQLQHALHASGISSGAFSNIASNIAATLMYVPEWLSQRLAQSQY